MEINEFDEKKKCSLKTIVQLKETLTYAIHYLLLERIFINILRSILQKTQRNNLKHVCKYHSKAVND